MDSFTTTTQLDIDVQPSETNKILLCIDGEVYPLTFNDAARLASKLQRAAIEVRSRS